MKRFFADYEQDLYLSDKDSEDLLVSEAPPAVNGHTPSYMSIPNVHIVVEIPSRLSTAEPGIVTRQLQPVETSAAKPVAPQNPTEDYEASDESTTYEPSAIATEDEEQEVGVDTDVDMLPDEEEFYEDDEDAMTSSDDDEEVLTQLRPYKEPLPSGLVYDERMLEHRPLHEEELDHPESGRRITMIHEALIRHGCFKLFKMIPAVPASFEDIQLVHTSRHVDSMVKTASLKPEELILESKNYESLYLNDKSSFCAQLSCGGVLALVDAVWTGKAKNGFAIVRPPGHHAEQDEPMGFCIYNNVAIAAEHLKRKHKLKRICIVDWDVHHGNGTQKSFYDDPNVLVISIHRFDGGKFYPGYEDADYTYVGGPHALGKNVNIPWPCGGFDDFDYLYAFQRVVEPIIAEFQPEMILTSCGFDAAKGDDMGGCSVTPAGYAAMTYSLLKYANGKLVLALEGGYQLNSVSLSAVACAYVLLGQTPIPLDSYLPPSAETLRVVNNVISVQGKYWKSLGLYQEDFEESAETTTIAEVIQVFQASRFEKLRFTDITRHLTQEPNFLVNVSYELLKASKIFIRRPNLFSADSLVIFVHDGPLIKYKGLTGENILNAKHSHLNDESFPLIHDFLHQSWGIIDVCVDATDPRQLPHRYPSLKGKDFATINKNFETKILTVLDAVYSKYVANSPIPSIMMLVSGQSTLAMEKFLQKPATGRRLNRIVQIFPSKSRPPVAHQAEDPAWIEWYKTSTINFIPGFGELWNAITLPKCGKIISLGEEAEDVDFSQAGVLTRHKRHILKLLETGSL